MSDLIQTVQLQEVGDSLVELFDITLPTGTIVHLFSGLEDGINNVYFTEQKENPSNPGEYVCHEYISIPIQITDMSFSATGAANRPSLSVANIPALSRSISNTGNGVGDETTLYEISKEETEGVLSQEGIYTNEDLLESRVVYRSTLAKHLKEGLSDTTAPVEFPSQTFILDRVASENSVVVQFELASPYDVEGVQIPSRQVNGRYCPWEYQGHFLSGSGGCTWPLDGRGRFYDKNDNLITADVNADFSTAVIYDPFQSSYLVGDLVFTGNFPRRYWTCIKNTNAPGLNPSTSPDYWAEVFETRLWSSSLAYPEGYIVRTEDTISGSGTLIRIWKAIRSVPAQKDPRTNSFYWERIDVCPKFISSCKVRFQGGGEELDTSKPLPFGGFPGTSKFR